MNTNPEDRTKEYIQEVVDKVQKYVHETLNPNDEKAFLHAEQMIFKIEHFSSGKRKTGQQIRRYTRSLRALYKKKNVKRVS